MSILEMIALSTVQSFARIPILNAILFIWVFHDRRFCQIIWQIFTQGRAKKNSSKIAPSGYWNQDLQIFRPMPYQLS